MYSKTWLQVEAERFALTFSHISHREVPPLATEWHSNCVTEENVLIGIFIHLTNAPDSFTSPPEFPYKFVSKTPIYDTGPVTMSS